MTRKSQRIWTGTALALLAVVLIARVVLPPLLLKNVNKFLAEFSPVYSLHMKDLDLSFLRMAYRFEGIEGKIKKSGEPFLNIEYVDVSIAWRELFRGRALTDIVVDGARFFLTNDLMQATGSKEQAQEDSRKAKRKLFPVRIERVEVRNSSFQFADLPKVPEAQRWRLTQIEGRASNITPTERAPKTFFSFNGTLLDSAEVKIAGVAELNKKPLEWDVDAELRHFDLAAANPLLLRILPLSFTAGHLDAYAEAISTGGQLRGYVKPFLEKVDVVANREQFKGAKHFLVEIVSALSNLILRKSDDKSVATEIDFHQEAGVLKVDTGKALSKTFEHGFEGGIPKGVEDRFHLQ